MSVAIPFLAFLFTTAFAAYHRLRLATWAALTATLLVACWLLGASGVATIVAAIVVALVSIPLLLPQVRKPYITTPLLKFYTKLLPPLSDTERTALESGTVGFEGELFSGKPDWDQLLSLPKPALTAEEQAFLDGPCEELCRMTDDWDINHVRADLPPEMWEFIKRNKFFGLNIPKEYDGLGFSALMNHKVIQKLASISTVVSSTVGVPNSLGPAELLMHYGTDEQKRYYLPRLADGREVPCFALTGPFAGSDATSIPDYGIVCQGEWNGANVLGIRLTLNKRYITLAPVATLIGVAFRMYDPDGLIGDVRDIGISLALVPSDTTGLKIGRRHFPLNSTFQNGPIQGDGVFVPLSQLIGGEDYAGKGWQMLMECLSIGRSITLPSTASGGAKSAAVVTGAYARIRKQFGLSVGRFEGVEEALARIAGKAYAISALSQATAAAVARGENPAVPSTIAKYHCTEMGREVIRDAMDIHGGKGIILGPRNYLGRGWQATPISITVEGANIMTRSLMIFGQGAILCHPWVMKEMKAAQLEDPVQRIDEFDRNLFGHIGYAISNAVRSWWFGLTCVEVRQGAGRRIHAPLLSQAQPVFGLPVGDVGHLDAAARRQAQVQGVAVGTAWRRAEPALHRQRDAQALRGRRPPAGRPAAAGVGLPRQHQQDRDRAVRRAAQLPDPPGRLVAVGADLPVWPPCAAAERPPRPSRRRVADDAVRCARAPGRGRVPHAVREQPGRPHRQLPAEGGAGRAGRAQVPQGTEEQRHRGAGVRPATGRRRARRLDHRRRTQATGRTAGDDAGCDQRRRLRTVGTAFGRLRPCAWQRGRTRRGVIPARWLAVANGGLGRRWHFWR